MPIVVDTKDLAPETAQDFPLLPEPSITAECHRGLESGVTEGARVRAKARIGNYASDKGGRKKRPERHGLQDSAVAISDELLEWCKRICGDGGLQDSAIAIQQLQTKTISQQPDGKGDGQAKAEIEDAE
jgi:hypothetical protein